jgi:hypothetical protein
MPLWLWAAHFFAAYVLVAASCMRGWAQGGVRAVMLVVTVAVAALLAAVLLRALQRCRGAYAGWVPALRAGAAALALVGVAWAALPMLVVPVCEGVRLGVAAPLRTLTPATACAPARASSPHRTSSSAAPDRHPPCAG